MYHTECMDVQGLLPAMVICLSDAVEISPVAIRKQITHKCTSIEHWCIVSRQYLSVQVSPSSIDPVFSPLFPKHCCYLKADISFFGRRKAHEYS